MSGETLERPRHCEHYNGRDLLGVLGKKVCKAGVDVLALVGGEEFGWFKRCPCFEGNETAVVCGKREFPSWEVVRERREELRRRVDQVVAVAGLIPKNGTSGTVRCPRCEGQLDWSRSSYNGHVHGKCRTPDCLAWME